MGKVLLLNYLSGHLNVSILCSKICIPMLYGKV